MSSDQTCPSCASPIDSSGMCPACLFDEALSGNQPSRNKEPGQPEVPGYELIELIGRGGSGAVYLALPAAGGPAVAIKIMARELTADPEYRGRFLREAETLRKLNHPGIVKLISSGEHDGRIYLILELAGGPSLAARLAGGKIDPAESLSLISDTLEALAYAHDQGIIHRDLKPSNLLLHDGSIRIADFGLARIVEETSDQALTLLTDSSSTPGTPRYMAPEQLDNQEVTARSDLYAIGVILYQLLTGQIPSGHFQPPSKISSSPSRLDRPVMRALATDPAERFPSAADFRTALQKASARKKPLWLALPLIALTALAIFLATKLPSKKETPPSPTPPHNFQDSFSNNQPSTNSHNGFHILNVENKTLSESNNSLHFHDDGGTYGAVELRDLTPHPWNPSSDTLTLTWEIENFSVTHEASGQADAAFNVTLLPFTVLEERKEKSLRISEHQKPTLHFRLYQDLASDTSFSLFLLNPATDYPDSPNDQKFLIEQITGPSASQLSDPTTLTITLTPTGLTAFLSDTPTPITHTWADLNFDPQLLSPNLASVFAVKNVKEGRATLTLTSYSVTNTTSE